MTAKQIKLPSAMNHAKRTIEQLRRIAPLVASAGLSEDAWELRMIADIWDKKIDAKRKADEIKRLSKRRGG